MYEISHLVQGNRINVFDTPGRKFKLDATLNASKVSALYELLPFIESKNIHVLNIFLNFIRFFSIY